MRKLWAVVAGVLAAGVLAAGVLAAGVLAAGVLASPAGAKTSVCDRVTDITSSISSTLRRDVDDDAAMAIGLGFAADDLGTLARRAKGRQATAIRKAARAVRAASVMYERGEFSGRKLDAIAATLQRIIPDPVAAGCS